MLRLGCCFPPYKKFWLRACPIFVFTKCCWSVHASGKAWQACAQRTEKSHSHTTSAVLRQVYAHALLIQHLSSSVFFQHMIWYGLTSETTYGLVLVWFNIRKFGCREGRKIGKNIPILLS